MRLCWDPRHHQVFIFTRGQFWPPGIDCRCLRLCVSVCVCPSVAKFADMITHHPFKLGSPHLEQRCKRPCLRSLLFCRAIDFDLQFKVKFNLEKSKFTPFCACPHHNSSPVQARITKMPIVFKIPTFLRHGWPWPSRSNLNFKCQNFWFHHYRKYITTMSTYTTSWAISGFTSTGNT